MDTVLLFNVWNETGFDVLLTNNVSCFDKLHFWLETVTQCLWWQTTVYVQVVFMKLGEIDTIKETFSADVYIQARWREPRLDGSHTAKNTVSFNFIHNITGILNW